MKYKRMPNKMKKEILSKFEKLPYPKRGIQINEKLIIITIEILNKYKQLPQNCRQVKTENKPFGLDKLINEEFGDDLRRANIISDELQKKGIVEVIEIMNEETGKLRKITRLLKDWQWKKYPRKNDRRNIIKIKKLLQNILTQRRRERGVVSKHSV